MYPNALLLPRHDLAEKARSIIDNYSLTAIVAPMGYGKTTLAGLVAEQSGPGTWFYSVPAGPHDARFLWHDMCDHFEEQGWSLAPDLRRLGFPQTASQSRQVLKQLLQHGAKTYLIIDDYHQVEDPAMHAFWELAARSELPGLKVIMFSRKRPEINLEELRIKRIAAVLEQRFLAFTVAETKAFFRMNGVGDAVMAEEAHRYSEGWPVAIWLCLQSWRHGGRMVLPPDIDSLLANTVFSSYDEEERDLMMRLSVFEYFLESDAEEIMATPAASGRLRTLREKNAFLTFDQKNGHYYFHGLFRNFLRRELQAATAIDKPALYRLAGECRLKHDDIILALRFWASAGRDEDLKRILDLFLLPEYDHSLVYFQEEISTAALGLPWRVRLQNPLGYLGFIAICLLTWNDFRAIDLIAEAKDRFLGQDDLPEFLSRRLQGEFEVLHGLCAFNDGWKLLEHYAEADRLLNGPSVVLSKGTAWSFGCPNLTFIFLRDRGQYLEAVETTEQYWHLYRQLSGGLGKAGEKTFRAEYLLEQGMLDEAEHLARGILNSCRSDRQIGTALAAALCLARASAVSGRAEEAAQTLNSLRPRVAQLDIFDHLEGLDLALGYLYTTLGRPEFVPQWLRDGDMLAPPHNALPQVLGFSLTIHCKTLLLREDYERLAAVVDDLTVCNAPLTCLLAQIHCKILKAMIAWHLRDPKTALQLLGEALDLCRLDCIVLTPAEYGGRLLPLLSRLKRGRPKDAHLAAVLTLAGRVAQATGWPSGQKNEKKLLSPREWEFMRYVAEGKSNAAIADNLGIKADSVKKTLSRAYVKLGAEGRLEAARRFLDLYGDQGRAPAPE